MTAAALSQSIHSTKPVRNALCVQRRLLVCIGLTGALAAGCINAPAAAEPLVPTVTFPAAKAALADHNIDILNLVPGMTSEEAREALLALPAPENIAEKKTFYSVASRGVKVQTSEFVETMSSGEDHDRVSVTFTGPASDNQVFVVERSTRYPDVLSAPTIETIIGALEAKYGAPSYNTRDFVDVNAPELTWAFKDGAQSPCQGLGGHGGGQKCPFRSGIMFYDPAQFADLAAENLSFDYAIIAQIETHNADRSKVAGFTITASDLKRRQQAASADMQAMLQELERVYAEASKPAAAPSM